MVRVLHEQGPPARGKPLEARAPEGAMLHVPRSAAAFHEARNRIRRARESEHLRGRKRIRETRKRRAQHERLALPVTAHEAGRIERTEALACDQNGLESI